MTHFTIDTTIYDTGMLIEHSKELPSKIWAFDHYDWQRYARELELRCSELSQKLLPLLSQDDAIEAWRKALNTKEQQLAAVTKERDEWKQAVPATCPITGLSFFMLIETPEGESVATYGGPYDSYTIPERDADGEFTRRRYDHDEGGWVDEYEAIGYFATDEDFIQQSEEDNKELQADRDRLAAELTELKTAKADAVKQAREAKSEWRYYKDKYSDRLRRYTKAECRWWFIDPVDSDWSIGGTPEDYQDNVPITESEANAIIAGWPQPAAPAATPIDKPKSRPFDEIHEEYRRKLMPQDATTSEPTVDNPWKWYKFTHHNNPEFPWIRYLDVANVEWYRNDGTKGTCTTLCGWKLDDDFETCGEPEAVRKWREEHEEKPRQALPREVDFWKNKVDHLAAQLAERDKTIANLQGTIREQDELHKKHCYAADSTRKEYRDMVKDRDRFADRNGELLGEIDKLQAKIAELAPLAEAMRWLESDMVNLDWDENTGEWDLWDGRKTYHGSTILEAIAAARAGK